MNADTAVLLLTRRWGKQSVPYAGCDSEVFRTSDSQSRNPGPIAVVSKDGQFRSLHVAPIHSTVLMKTWL